MCQRSQQSAFIAFNALTAIPTGGEEMQTSVCAASVLYFLKQLLNIFVFLSLIAFSTRSTHMEERSMKKPSTALTHVCMISWSGHTYSRWTDVQTKILTTSSNGRCFFVVVYVAPMLIQWDVLGYYLFLCNTKVLDANKIFNKDVTFYIISRNAPRFYAYILSCKAS